ncbi:protein-tyrosine phosphatase-like protein [Kockovaella imperatae]|uniref:Protein-tyrosine phosphatase-like protein n=1 Tax=Kockovaella imperatae TaxID=4999 RepID=A0A1Y1UAA6_9TREE|nr:protein-tyrosine phosphatase-like protein [Kockovaella imperatae]ORX34963.1 protein-tyrosine phosphatase-like protein [Kockovaella imperatae]
MDKLRVSTVDNVILERYVPPPIDALDDKPKKQRLTGQLHLVQHHLFFSPRASSSTSQPEEIWIPYPAINLLTRLPQSIEGLYPLKLRTRTFETFLFLFEKDREGGAEDVWTSIKDCAVASSVEQLYAFFYRLPSHPALNPQSEPSRPTSLNPSSPLSLSSKEPDVPFLSSKSQPSTGWDTFNPRTEFARQGVGVRTKAWRFTDINKDYSFCPTYPAKLVVPSRISDNVLSHAGKYRSKARIPALSYLHWANHASITRSSQPMVGLKNSRSAQDEKLVECIFTTHTAAESAYAPSTQSADPLSPSPSSSAKSLPHVYGATATNLIIDARPTTNAMANVAMGAGTENMDNYRSGKKAYLGIDNIHVMRNSLKTIDDAVREAEETGDPIDRISLRKSNWLRHISTILDGALMIIRNIHLNASHVLIHCSDGWDRTAQLSAMAQICLDPYYRTIEGFKVLIEKDFLAFGHKFLDRSGHLSSEKLFTVADQPDDESDDELGGAQKAAQAFFASMQKQFTSSNSHLKEVSPVFHQFLDCVWQIQRQYPSRFEFNEQFLIDLHYHLYACQLGTFLFNNEHQRRVARPPQGDDEGGAYVDRTVSAWDYLKQPNYKTTYLNEAYDPSLDARDSRDDKADQGVLLFEPKDVKFWWRLFRRGDEEMNGSKLALQHAQTVALPLVGAGQVDPVSIEGAVQSVERAASLDVPYSVRRTPSPAHLSTSASARDLDVRSSHTPSSLESGYTTIQPMPSKVGVGNRASGWNWGQLSSGALNALQKGARDIRSIGQEAMQQLRAEAGSADGEMWSRSDQERQKDYAPPGTGIGEGRLGREVNDYRQSPRPTVRLPSENNPWASGNSSAKAIPKVMVDHEPIETKMDITGQDDRNGESNKRKESVTLNPWGESRASPSLADLFLRDVKPVTRDQMPSRHPTNGKPHSSASRQEEDEVAAALGGDSKAWDPLGAV